MDKHLGYGSLSSPEGQLTVPDAVRRKLRLDDPQTVVEFVERDGEIVALPRVAVHPNDVWFWTPESQAAEREADEDIAAGRTTSFDSEDAFLHHLDKLAGRKLGEDR
ncbi:AbrB/MazE/SpoVT family DNA-binding domain-containing protein [Streptomonospora sp. S1-112]|uniref:AbrB/MazE/SpoVT family DNA-binding domain-containing protein n=1 Tax=Streptomonospora mangrovi TaxID=2883123 RepID=A0A9X3NG02_9ACTN|nr:AbrB/MazE/SpoVT family DNA-binding domain-containing protein [Streptomonospora mangrovi]MDA0562852.1 AbrB/MazE/SpoVT family DNA-binding domain-containing protein [Streptomonospora mangrovi]